MSVSQKLHTSLRGVLGALQFAWIPIVCAAAIAIASEQTTGKAIAAAVALAAFMYGVFLHAGEIFLGRSTPRPSPLAPTRLSTGEWMARVR